VSEVKKSYLFGGGYPYVCICPELVSVNPRSLFTIGNSRLETAAVFSQADDGRHPRDLCQHSQQPGRQQCDGFRRKTGKKTVLLSLFFLNTTVLPRQARDKHRQTQKQTPFSMQGNWNSPDMLQVGNPGFSFNESLAHFMAWSVPKTAIWSCASLLMFERWFAIPGSRLA